MVCLDQDALPLNYNDTMSSSPTSCASSNEFFLLNIAQQCIVYCYGKPVRYSIPDARCREMRKTDDNYISWHYYLVFKLVVYIYIKKM